MPLTNDELRVLRLIRHCQKEQRAIPPLPPATVIYQLEGLPISRGLQAIKGLVAAAMIDEVENDKYFWPILSPAGMKKLGQKTKLPLPKVTPRDKVDQPPSELPSQERRRQDNRRIYEFIHGQPSHTFLAHFGQGGVFTEIAEELDMSKQRISTLVEEMRRAGSLQLHRISNTNRQITAIIAGGDPPTAQKPPRKKGPISGIQRTLTVLAGADGPLSVSEIAERAGISTATGYAFVAEYKDVYIAIAESDKPTGRLARYNITDAGRAEYHRRTSGSTAPSPP